MEPGNRFRRVLWGGVIFLALIGTAVAVRRMVNLVPILLHGYRPPAPASNPVAEQFSALDDLFAHYPVLTLVHIVPGLLFMLLGPLQFSSTIRVHHLRWHRWSGRVFVACGFVIGISALIMSLGMPAIGGVNQAVATTLFGSYFLLALSRAFWLIRRREVALHREWMIRAFSIGLAVATIRPIMGIFFATSRISGLTPREFFGIAFWIGFVLHLIAAEAWIRATSHPTLQTTQSRQRLEPARELR
ncbi:MAG TPA: DUF2306 domain-containing protein [Candidatus Acidoferrum sp.]|jgi:uncharacterized membrane protein|nr:DUF2306 domain-containing protein [Candidatus Acidoferrum sp.]